MTGEKGLSPVTVFNIKQQKKKKNKIKKQNKTKQKH